MPKTYYPSKPDVKPINAHNNHNGNGHTEHGNGNGYGHHKDPNINNLPIGDNLPILLTLLIVYSITKFKKYLLTF